jgi:hypothetical protein
LRHSATMSCLPFTDAGKSWNPIALPIPDAYAREDVAFGTPSFFDSSSGVVPMLFSGDLPALVVDVTTDGGKTWSSTTALAIADGNPEGGTPPAFSAVNSADWFMATPGRVSRSTDGGKSWTSAETNVSLAGATVLAFSSAQTGWALASVSSSPGESSSLASGPAQGSRRCSRWRIRAWNAERMFPRGCGNLRVPWTIDCQSPGDHLSPSLERRLSRAHRKPRARASRNDQIPRSNF